MCCPAIRIKISTNSTGKVIFLSSKSRSPGAAGDVTSNDKLTAPLKLPEPAVIVKPVPIALKIRLLNVAVPDDGFADVVDAASNVPLVVRVTEVV